MRGARPVVPTTQPHPRAYSAHRSLPQAIRARVRAHAHARARARACARARARARARAHPGSSDSSLFGALNKLTSVKIGVPCTRNAKI